MPRIRPQSNNIKIKVSTQQTDDTVNVSTTNGTNPVKASNNMAEYWSNKSKEWAISENIVDNTDHSSKYYAGQAKEAYDGIDELVDGFEQTVEDATTNSIEEITESKDDAIADIIIEGGNQVNLVESTGGDLLTQMTSLKDTTLGYKNDAQSSANSASVSETNAHTYETNALSYSNSASGSASIATQKATEAASSAINASESELNALAYSNSASSSALSASTSESNASTSETNAQTYANNANTSATNAATSEDNANIWAEGSDAEVQELGGVHSAKGWAEVSSSGQVQSDYTESDSTKKSFIKNKPDLTVYATQTDLTNGLATKQDTLIAGTDLEIVNATTPRLPAGFTELEWLQSDGACCIDLGVISYGNDEVEQKFQRPSTFESNIISWFGSIQNNAVPRFSIGASSSSGVFAGFNFTKPLIEYDNNIHIITLKKIGSTYYAGIDGEVVSYVPTSASTNPSINSYLFARNGSTITYDGTGTRIFYHKQNRFGGTPLLDIVPARRDSDNALGVYNLVSNTFLGNIGTGTFIGGPEVIYPTTTTINFTNESGYIKGIDSTDVINALGYTPYDSANPDNYTSNVGTVTSVNNIEPDENGNVTIQTGGATDVQINSTSITSGGVANIITNTAYDASSNKIATMSDLPDNEIFIAEYGVTSYADVLAAYNAGKTIVCKYTTNIVTDTVNRFLCLEKFQFTPNTTVGSFLFGSLVDGSNSGIYYMAQLNNSSSWSALNSYNCEKTSNKVTSISSSSTNTQYPSAKLLYDQLALKQNASTAVTHTASTAVGSSTVPVYVNSSGVATSTGLSIANSRFDGQWVAKETSLTTSTAVNTYTLDLVNYLPSGGGKYEVLVACNITSNNTSPSNTRLYSDVISISTNYLNQKTPNTSHSLQAGCLLILPVTRYLYFKIENHATASTSITAVGYRRIGTNT